MLSYCLKWRKKTDIKKPKGCEENKGKPMLLSKHTVCGSRKSRLIKEQEARGIWSSLGLRTPLS